MFKGLNEFEDIKLISIFIHPLKIYLLININKFNRMKYRETSELFRYTTQILIGSKLDLYFIGITLQVWNGSRNMISTIPSPSIYFRMLWISLLNYSADYFRLTITMASGISIDYLYIFDCICKNCQWIFIRISKIYIIFLLILLNIIAIEHIIIVLNLEEFHLNEIKLSYLISWYNLVKLNYQWKIKKKYFQNCIINF